MSMTKAVCTVAALQLVERGELDPAAPVDEHCPAFAAIPVLDGFDGATPRLRRPARRATVRHLLTQTAGLAYGFWNADAARCARAGIGPALVADPGTAFAYGASTDWLGRVVEAVAGASLDVVIRRGITEPLGMADTAFALDEDERRKLAPVHVRGDDGAWTPGGPASDPRPARSSGGHGLFSTPRDYARFQRALLRGGELDGERILRPSTVDAAFANQLGHVRVPAELRTADPRTAGSLRLGGGWAWGHGLMVTTADVPGRRRAGAGGWSGLYNTHFWVDRAAGICGALYSSALPFLAPEAWRAYAAFEAAVYASAEAGSRKNSMP
jgi:CubicO group peptidase (beta-lactamase class C family)